MTNGITIENYEPPMGYLFHGTLEPFQTELSISSYPDMLWTAENPAVAQAYISAVGSMALASVLRWRIDEHVPPAGEHDRFGEAWRELAGAQFDDVQYDASGRPKSYRIIRRITWADMAQALIDLGYEFGDGESAWVKTTDGPDGEVLLPANYRATGRLFILRPIAPLCLLDLTDAEGDLMDPAYRWFKVFKQVSKKGYDGVRINDFLQSEHFGNFGHVSVGLFDAGLDKMEYTSITAQRFDSPEIKQWLDGTTPEFEDWIAG